MGQLESGTVIASIESRDPYSRRATMADIDSIDRWPENTKLGLALSGGGFRASFFHIKCPRATGRSRPFAPR